ncbi:MAG TPA: hypothetical protein VFQ91_03655 [Bryobacteraceae bacterium]|nr:hypothetical protein [Bryobacteraceae bacterium]
MIFRLVAAHAAVLSVSVLFAQTTPPAPSAPATMERPRIGKPPILPVSQVKKGMQAIAWTVFEGTQPEPIPVEIIGVWKNANGPKADVILGRMGGRAARTNVAGGMSGSPVYINGKLIGAVALRLSFFSPDAICGITPIESMLEIDQMDQSKPPQRAAMEIPGDILASAGIPAQQSMMLQPIDTPLMMSGAAPEIFPYMNGIFKSMGLQLVQGGSSAALKSTTLAPDWKSSLQPGDTVSMILVSGDVNISSGCTVTYNDGSRVLICGHAFLNIGPLNMPMAKGEIIWTLASSFQPTKVSNATEVVGTFTQDRHLGMLGRLGEKPRMIPVRLTLRSLNTQGNAYKTNTLNFDVMENQKFTPQLMMLGLFNAISGMNEFADDTTYRIAANITLANGEKVDLRTMAAPSETPVPASLQSAIWFGDKFNKLFGNAVRMPDLGRVEATVDLIPERRTAVIESAWTPASDVVPGAEVPVKVYLRPYRGGRVEREVRLKVPLGLAPGNYRIQLSEAAVLNNMQAMAPLANRFMDLSQTISLINQERPNNRLYAALVQPRPTVYTEDRTMPNLPSSVLNVMQNGRTSSRTLIAAPETAVAEASIPFDYVVTGSQSLRLTVK